MEGAEEEELRMCVCLSILYSTCICMERYPPEA